MNHKELGLVPQDYYIYSSVAPKNVLEQSSPYFLFTKLVVLLEIDYPTQLAPSYNPPKAVLIDY